MIPAIGALPGRRSRRHVSRLKRRDLTSIGDIQGKRDATGPADHHGESFLTLKQQFPMIGHGGRLWSWPSIGML
jgi:hypothetical protein